VCVFVCLCVCEREREKLFYTTHKLVKYTHTHALARTLTLRSRAHACVTTYKFCLLRFLTEGRKEGRGVVVLECRSDYWNDYNQFPVCGVCHRSQSATLKKESAMQAAFVMNIVCYFIKTNKCD